MRLVASGTLSMLGLGWLGPRMGFSPIATDLGLGHYRVTIVEPKIEYTDPPRPLIESVMSGNEHALEVLGDWCEERGLKLGRLLNDCGGNVYRVIPTIAQRQPVAVSVLWHGHDTFEVWAIDMAHMATDAVINLDVLDPWSR